MFSKKKLSLKGLLLLSLGCLQSLAHPVPESPKWLTYPGADGPGKGKHIVLIAADQEYRSEQAMPMMAGILSKHHGFDCTVLFGVNKEKRQISRFTTSPAWSTSHLPISSSSFTAF